MSEEQFNDDRGYEEAHFFWTIKEFEELIIDYGVHQVVREMNPEVSIKLLGALQHELL